LTAAKVLYVRFGDGGVAALVSFLKAVYNNIMSFRGTVIIQKEDKWFVATCIENNIASQGRTVDEAMSNLKEAISLYFEDSAVVPEYEPVYVTALEMAV
jgi:predicted RNase H-like HicB family nuclease